MQRQTGKIKWFNEKDGYGFIVPDAGGRDVFVHIRQLTRSGLRPDELTEGAPVSYVLRDFKGKDQAEDLQIAA